MSMRSKFRVLGELGRPVYCSRARLYMEPLVAPHRIRLSLIFLHPLHPPCLLSHNGVSLVVCGPRSS